MGSPRVVLMSGGSDWSSWSVSDVVGSFEADLLRGGPRGGSCQEVTNNKKIWNRFNEHERQMMVEASSKDHLLENTCKDHAEEYS